MDAEEFCRAAYPRLARALGSFTGDRLLGEELAQEALLRVWIRWDQVEAMDAPAMWVYRTGLNLARSTFRRRAAERRALLRAGTAPASTHDEPADAIAVRDEIAQLPDRQRTAIVLRYHADLDVEQAAQVMRCAPGTVKALTHQGIARLRERLLIADDEPVDRT